MWGGAASPHPSIANVLVIEAILPCVVKTQICQVWRRTALSAGDVPGAAPDRLNEAFFLFISNVFLDNKSALLS